ncbi:MAG: CDP-alcohol phosphatidyltransferase family protein [Thermoplasmata archaeon]
MVLEEYRGRVAPYVARLARPFLSWRPSTLTWTALALCAAASVLAASVRWSSYVLFLPVALLIFFGGVFDVLDGEVARRTGRASVQGDLLDHVVDRYADIILVLGIAVSGYVNPILALLALVSLLLTSYMGTQAQAVGLGRHYGGLLTRADRLLLLALGAFLVFDLSLPWPWAPTAPWSRFQLAGVSFTVLDLVFLYFVVAGQVTAVLRARSIYAELGRVAPSTGKDASPRSATEPPRMR